MDLDSVGVRRARAHAQLLDSPARSPTTVVKRLVGVQAQEVRAAALSIRARTTGLTASSVTHAIASGELILTWTLRGTRHLHTPEDAAWLLAFLAPLYDRPSKRDADLGVAGAVGERAVATLVRALDSDGPLDRAQVKERLAPVGVNPTGQAAIHIIRRAALKGLLSVVTGDDGKERYSPPAVKLPSAAPDDAATELARRYLRGYGPATPADFAAWSGLGLRAAEAAWPRRARTAPTPPEPTPLRLLGGFDNLLLGYADRTPTLAAEHARTVNAGGGLVKPVVVDDGRVVGTWAPPDKVDRFPGEEFDPTEELADVRRFLTGGRTG